MLLKAETFFGLPTGETLRERARRLSSDDGPKSSRFGVRIGKTCVKPEANDAYSMLTARAASSAMTSREISACSIVMILAQRESTGASVGEKAVLVLKARKR